MRMPSSANSRAKPMAGIRFASAISAIRRRSARNSPSLEMKRAAADARPIPLNVLSNSVVEGTLRTFRRTPSDRAAASVSLSCLEALGFVGFTRTVNSAISGTTVLSSSKRFPASSRQLHGVAEKAGEGSSRGLLRLGGERCGKHAQTKATQEHAPADRRKPGTVHAFYARSHGWKLGQGPGWVNRAAR